MSFNESTLSNSNYPAMTQSQWDASPMAETEPPERDFDICISQSLSKSTTVTTTRYNPIFDDEDGRMYAETDDTDWREVCDDTATYTPLELIAEFKKHLQEQLETLPKNKRHRCLHLIEECEGWIEDDIEIVEE